MEKRDMEKRDKEEKADNDNYRVRNQREQMVILASAAVFLMILGQFMRRGGLMDLSVRWFENALFLVILVIAVFDRRDRSPRIWLSLAVLSLLGVLGETLYFEVIPYRLPVAAEAVNTVFYLLLMSVMSLLLCRLLPGERRGRLPHKSEAAVCLLLAAASAALSVWAGKCYESYFTAIFYGNSMGLFSLMTSDSTGWIDTLYRAARIIPKAACIWVTARCLSGGMREKK